MRSRRPYTGATAFSFASTTASHRKRSPVRRTNPLPLHDPHRVATAALRLVPPHVLYSPRRQTVLVVFAASLLLAAALIRVLLPFHSSTAAKTEASGSSEGKETVRDFESDLGRADLGKRIGGTDASFLYPQEPGDGSSRGGREDASGAVFDRGGHEVDARKWAARHLHISHSLRGHQLLRHLHRRPVRGTLIFSESRFNGLGAQTLRIMDALAAADILGASLRVQPARYWNYGCAPWRGWDCYFRGEVAQGVGKMSPLVGDATGDGACRELHEVVAETASPGRAKGDSEKKKRIQSRRLRLEEFRKIARKLPDRFCIRVGTPESADLAAEMLVIEALEAGREAGLKESSFAPEENLTRSGSSARGQGRNEAGVQSDGNWWHPFGSRVIEMARMRRKGYDSALSHSSNSATLSYTKYLAERVWRLAPSTEARVTARLYSAGVQKAKAVDGVLRRPRFVCKEDGAPYVGVHVRRGDKRKEVRLIAIRKYVRAIEAISPAGTPVFVASDDGVALRKLRKALEEKGRTVMELDTAKYRTGHHQAASNRFPLKKNRPRVEALLAEVQALSRAHWFVGTFSSNLGRLIHVLRGDVSADTSISVDNRWAAGVAYKTFGTHYCEADDSNQAWCKAEKERFRQWQKRKREKKPKIST